jgi:hypothetical protein
MDGVYRISQGVDWGGKTKDHVMVLRGDWTEENGFSLELREVGEPFYCDATITLHCDRLESRPVDALQAVILDCPLGDSPVGARALAYAAPTGRIKYSITSAAP